MTLTAQHSAPPVSGRSFYALTPFGCFWIAAGNLGTTLSLDSRVVARFGSPHQAARAVAAHETGHPEWDRSGFVAPDGLSDWGQLIRLGSRHA